MLRATSFVFYFLCGSVKGFGCGRGQTSSFTTDLDSRSLQHRASLHSFASIYLLRITSTISTIKPRVVQCEPDSKAKKRTAAL